jgi:hypothetical protein
VGPRAGIVWGGGEIEFIYALSTFMGRGSSVGIATRYGVDGPAIESRWGGEIFFTRTDRPCGPPTLLYKGYRVIPGGKTAEAWRRPPTPSIGEVKESVELFTFTFHM